MNNKILLLTLIVLIIIAGSCALLFYFKRCQHDKNNGCGLIPVNEYGQSLAGKCLMKCDQYSDVCYNACHPNDDCCIRKCYAQKAACYMDCLESNKENLLTIRPNCGC